MGLSLDSSRPLMAPSVISHRDSTYIACYSDSLSLNRTPTRSSVDSAEQEFHEIEAIMEKLENKELSTQRFVPTEEKIAFLSKLALSAKLARALQRRLRGQDAVMRLRNSQLLNEKSMDCDVMTYSPTGL
ncbi:hypothetical protein GcC1_115017 [Golovinomyces cichoracearum]|uniref:Uncharacterized protein n=1 Tax=Golovinomyces cichoracearum TaxID=62708 RepID=A0A420I7Y4_9PEZI|nr:hypothetical protein GcC1_115017 [Golovinomyces cichoracearum]